MGKVLIVNSSFDYARMFEDKGWSIVKKMDDADLVQFTGGEDVTPELYNHKQHASTGNNPGRDYRESIVFKAALQKKIPMAGICRGGQFLNVMCGGTMWQDVDKHCVHSHEIRDMIDGTVWHGSSTHHQMMRIGASGILVAAACESSRRLFWDVNTQQFATIFSATPVDAEVIHYPNQNCLCFQPHPEFIGRDELANKYFDYLFEYLEVI